jgi:hypothetical protein
VVITILFVSAPMQSDVDAWINSNGLAITTVKDPDSMPLDSLQTLGRRETAYVVDLRTMRILQKYLGDVTGHGTSSAQQALNAAWALIGPKGG